MLYLLAVCNSFVTNTLRFHDILVFRISRQRPGWQHHRDRGAFSQGAVNVQFSAVAVHDMFDDRKAKTRATKFTAAVIINPVEPFGHARQVKRVHASAIINDLDLTPGRAKPPPALQLSSGGLCAHRRRHI